MRNSIDIELKKIYVKVKKYYIEKEGKESRTVRIVNQVINNFDGTILTEEIMKELKYLYLDKYGRIFWKIR